MSDSKQACLVPNPKNQSSVVLCWSFSVIRNEVSVSVLLNTLDTRISIQRGRKIGYGLPVRTDFNEAPNLKKHQVKDCPTHAIKDFVLKGIKETNSLDEKVSMKSEKDDGLYICSSFPERALSFELECDKPVFPEIIHLRGEIGEGEFELLGECSL